MLGMPHQLKINHYSEIKSPSLYSTEIAIDNDFPEDEVNRLSKIEAFNKHLYRPNTYIHKWWARRSGTTFRYILKQFVTEESFSDYYSSGGLKGKIIMDPMMGGGTTIHEAIRMGANVIGFDIDPIPVLQVKTALMPIPLLHKREVFNGFFTKLHNHLQSEYFTKCPECGISSEIQFILRGLKVNCDCHDALSIDSYILRQEANRAVRLCPKCSEIFSENHECQINAKDNFIVKGEKICEKCGSEFRYDKDAPFPERYIPYAIVGKCKNHGLFFKKPDSNDLEFESALNRRKPIERKHPIHDGPKSSDLIAHGVKFYEELFTPRQIHYLEEAKRLIELEDPKDATWLSLLVSTSLEFNSLLCGYKGAALRRPGAIRHVFSHHAFTFPYTSLENNPINSEKVSGSLMRLFNDRILKATEWAINPTEIAFRGEKTFKIRIQGEIDQGFEVKDWNELTEGERRFLILQTDAGSVDVPANFVDCVITDPPYYDSVQYGDLSNFFRVWLKRMNPGQLNWDYDITGAAVAANGNDTIDHYTTSLTNIWKMCNRALKPESGRLVFTYHHWNPEAWASLTDSLLRSNFSLVNRYVVFSENPTSVHINGLKALSHDVILVLEPNTGKKQKNKWEKPADLNQSDSYRFCQDCGSLVGWLLCTHNESESTIGIWKELIGGGKNG